MARIRLKSINLDIKDIFGEEFVEIKEDFISLRSLLQELTRKAGTKITFIQNSGAIVNEAYTILLNGQSLQIQTTGLETKLRLKEGDELNIIRINIFSGG
jgi:hypothetical protein